MSDSRLLHGPVAREKAAERTGEIQTELLRKSIHMLVALVPAMASINIHLAQSFLASAVIIYSVCELLRMNGRRIALISGITAAASRERDRGRFVLGPVTLAIGAMLALMLYPMAAAEIAIYALAFGDSAASIIGKQFGKLTIPGFNKKTLEGTTACFFAVFAVTVFITADLKSALIIGVGAALIELVPVKDLDNLLLPVGTGVIAVSVL